MIKGSERFRIPSKLQYQYLNLNLTSRLKEIHDVSGWNDRQITKTKEKSRQVTLNADMLRKPFFSQLLFFNYHFET